MSEPNTTEVELLRHGLHDLARGDGPGDGDRAHSAVDAVLARGRRARRLRRTTAVCAAALFVAGGSLGGLRLAGGDPHSRPVVAAPATSVAVATPLPTRSLDYNHLQLGPAHPAVGTRYPFDLTVHCGIRYAEFSGHSWETQQDVPVPYPTLDPKTNTTTETGMLAGYVTVLSADTIRYEAPGVVPVVFHLMDHQAPLCE